MADCWLEAGLPMHHEEDSGPPDLDAVTEESFGLRLQRVSAQGGNKS